MKEKTEHEYNLLSATKKKSKLYSRKKNSVEKKVQESGRQEFLKLF